MNLYELYEKLFSDDAMLTFDKIANAINNMSRFGERIIEGYIAFENWWQTAYTKICEVITDIDTPEYTAEKKNELIECYTKWGKYGWTFNGQTGLTEFSSLPLSLEDADQRMVQYCALENVYEIKNKLIDSGVNQLDLEEALFCYENGKYKSSALILFALIDHQLISKGFRKRPTNKKALGDYKSGYSAIDEYKRQNEKSYEESFLYANLYFINIIETLSTMFRNTENFTNEENIINRNFISHGMSKRTVTDIDCFKVWSTLYSLVVLLPILEDMKI